MSKVTTYKDSGVDIDAGNRLVKTIGKLVKPTLRPEVVSGVGGFSALVSLAKTPYKNPVLVSSTDGVGTKLKIAFMSNKHDTIGIDLVAMCVNDVIVTGAEPLFFLDYFATGKLQEGVAENVIKGIADGCLDANCSLVGGETAEMPGMYSDDEYDLAGFSVGVADRDNLIDGSSITVGDSIIGIASSGLHSNGYSLVRKVLLIDGGLGLDDKLRELGGLTLGEELLKPTKIYVRTLLNIKRDFTIKGAAHITGGGLPENLPRVLPKTCKAVVKMGSWPIPPIFTLIQKMGGVPEDDLFRTLNCGIGMCIIVSGNQTDEILERLGALGEKAYLIGKVADNKGNGPEFVFE